MTGLVWLYAILDTADKAVLRVVQFDSEKVVQLSHSETQRCSKILFLFPLELLILCFVDEGCREKARGVLYGLKDSISLQNSHFCVHSRASGIIIFLSSYLKLFDMSTEQAKAKHLILLKFQNI